MTTKRKRLEATQIVEPSSQVNVVYSILECYDILAKNEYSEETIGISAFLTRKSVGDINFSDMIDDNEKRNRQSQSTDFTLLLDERRKNLPEIDASMEKCLMLTRLSFYVQENEATFTALLSTIRIDMQLRMADSPNNRNIQYPDDFRQREKDFDKRRDAQEKRRLFHYSQRELDPTPNLVYLQNRTTEHLTYLKNQMASNPKSRDACMKEFENIFRSSFMIVAHPHSGVNPTTIYDRKAPGQYTAKISVFIISLLHDFMQSNPNLIELYHIEPSLCPTSDQYKLEEPQSLAWKTCQLQTTTVGEMRSFKYADVTNITIGQASKTDSRVRFAQALHTFKFAIKLQLNLANSKASPIYQLSLESLPFAIGAHNSQIPQLLTRVIFDDIRRFTKPKIADPKTVQNFLQRYFIHRTGVQLNPCVISYLEQELLKANNQRGQFLSTEDIYMDFTVNFVQQVEFMAKHPILAMFHADGLFLGICSSERAAEAIVQTSISGSPVIGLRFNAIRIDYNAVSALSAANRAVKINPCAIRVDIYNDRTKKLQNRTFDSTSLAIDISKFVASAHTDNADRIHILSNFDDKANTKKSLKFAEFSKYYHPRLQAISKNDEKYKPVTDLVDNATDGNTEAEVPESPCDSSSSFSLCSPSYVPSIPPTTPLLFDINQNPDEMSNHDYVSIAYEGTQNTLTSPQNVSSLSSQIPTQSAQYVNQQKLLELVLSQPDVTQEVLRQIGIYNIANPIVSPPQSMQNHSPPSLPYTTQQMPSQYQNRGPVPSNFPPGQVIYQPPQYQQGYQQGPLMYPQQNSQGHLQPTLTQPQQQNPLMYYQQSYPQQQQQQQYFQQQPIVYRQQPPIRASTVIHHRPPSSNQQNGFSIPRTQPAPVQTMNEINNISQRFSSQIQILNLTEGDLNLMPTDSFEQTQTDPNLLMSDETSLDDFLNVFTQS